TLPVRVQRLGRALSAVGPSSRAWPRPLRSAGTARPTAHRSRTNRAAATRAHRVGVRLEVHRGARAESQESPRRFRETPRVLHEVVQVMCGELSAEVVQVMRGELGAEFALDQAQKTGSQSPSFALDQEHDTRTRQRLITKLEILTSKLGS